MVNMKSSPVDNASFLLQLLNLELLFNDFNNTDLMEKINVIIRQNSQILDIFEERSEDNGRKSNK